MNTGYPAVWRRLLRRLVGRPHSDTAARIEEERRNILSQDSDFFMRESYKALRTNVTFALAGQEGSKVMAVTSAMQAEGKSITAVNLAISFAELDQRVLLVDCDLRRPKLARLLSQRVDTGLSNVLVRPQLLESAIRPAAAGMDVLFSGDIPPNPSELLGSARMRALLEGLRDRYDCIILDTPPVNMVTDACVLAPVCDGVLFVVRADCSERGPVLHALEQMEYAKARMLGFVLNGTGEGEGYGYRKYGYRKYGYWKYGYGGYYGSGRREEAAPAGGARP